MKKYMLFLAIVMVALFIVGCQKESVSEMEASEPAGEAPVREATQPVAREPVQQEETAAPRRVVTAGEVQVLGKEGFDQEELSVRAGSAVAFVNSDPAEKDMTLVFQKDGSRTFLTTQVIQPGETYEQVFEEAGDYDFWTIGYGLRGKITVE